MHGTLASHTTLKPQVFTPWSPGDKPEDHPMWQEQVELELAMVQRGADKYRARVAKARAKGEMTSVKAFHYKVEEMVPVMVRYLKAWLTKVRQSRGANPLSYEQLSTIDPGVASFICLRTILDGVTIGDMHLTSVAHKIGMEVEYQARMDAWMAKEPDLFFGVQKSISKHATSRHIRRVNINRFNALMREKLNWESWSRDLKLHVGLRLVDIAVQATKMFEVVSDKELQHGLRNGRQHDRPIGRKTAKDITPAYVIRVAEPVLEELMNRVDADETRYPQYLPCLMPPKRWQGIFDGGYYTPVVRKPTLVRFHAEGEELRQAALEEYDAIDMPRVMSALHYIQEVPWMVNRKVLEVALRIWDRDLAIAGFPKQDLMPLPPRPADMDTNEKAAKEWKRKAAGVYGENARRVSKAGTVRTTLEIAEMFMHREFYFPHMLDFRGRMYPIPIYLQPQGNDLARGLLAFAKGQPVGERGGEWLAIHLANHFGADKMTYEGRIQWVKDNEEVWRTIASDPIGSHHLWLDETGIKHHWQGLAAVFEWVRYLEEGPEMISCLPIHIDGTCNGIQHLSAMMRDEVGGAAVNLVPDAEPHDIYGDVAAKLQERLEGIRDAGGAQGRYAQLWLDACGGKIPRSLTKKPVMTTPYGATREAHFGSLYTWLKEEVEDKGRLPFSESPTENNELKKYLVPWLIKHLEDALKDIVARAKQCMKWLQDVAKAVAETNQPIVWKTPSGFVVRHFYGAIKSKRLKTIVDGKLIKLRVNERSTTLSEKEQLQGIPPNFTHSMDASANTETIIRLALDSTQPPVTAIHDAYGTVAGAMWQLFAAVRGAFMWVHSDDVLLDYRNVCVSMYRDHLLATRNDLEYTDAWQLADETIKRLPTRGDLDISAVATSDYFFA